MSQVQPRKSVTAPLADDLAPMHVAQWDEPCELHDYHSPVTVINEHHHIFPQELQRKLWGETRDQRVVTVCSTGHNTITYGWQQFLKDYDWPEWLRGRSRIICELGWQRYLDACKELGVAP